MCKTVTLRLDDEVYGRFRGLAARDNRPLSNFIETAVFGLAGTDFAEQSYVEEWGNRWVAGRDQDRRTQHVLR